MLLKPKTISQAPYGAFELKINYQYNLLRAALVTSAFAGAIVAALFIHSALAEKTVIVVPMPPGEEGGSFYFDPLPTKPKPRRPGMARPRTARGGLTGIPVPVEVLAVSIDVADTLWNEVVVGEISFGSSVGADGGGNPGRESISSGLGLPGVGEFVPYEIAPRVIEWSIPEYPQLARAAGIEGVVLLDVLVDENGVVRDVQILRESGAHAGFERAAVDVAWSWIFSPAIQNGIPIAVRVAIPFRFILSR